MTLTAPSTLGWHTPTDRAALRSLAARQGENGEPSTAFTVSIDLETLLDAATDDRTADLLATTIHPTLQPHGMTWWMCGVTEDPHPRLILSVSVDLVAALGALQEETVALA